MLQAIPKIKREAGGSGRHADRGCAGVCSKGASSVFGRDTRGRFCSDQCRKASRCKAQDRYRATMAGQEERNGQSRRYRERVGNRKPPAGAAVVRPRRNHRPAGQGPKGSRHHAAGRRILTGSGPPGARARAARSRFEKRVGTGIAVSSNPSWSRSRTTKGRAKPAGAHQLVPACNSSNDRNDFTTEPWRF